MRHAPFALALITTTALAACGDNRPRPYVLRTMCILCILVRRLH